MADDYTPTTEEVLDWFAWDTDGFENQVYRKERREAADRWLAVHDREVAEKAWEQGVEAERFNRDFPGTAGWPRENPYRIVKDNG